MAGAGTVILGTLAGAAVVGGTLVAIDPLGARQAAAPNGATEEFDDTTQIDRPGEALAVLGYAPTGQVTAADVKNFQSDVNEVLTWVRATKAGRELVPPPGAGFFSVPLALQGIPAAPALELSGNLDVRTLMALAKVIEVSTLASGAQCLTPQGQAVEASIAACQSAWQEAFRYAYEANLTAPQSASLPTA